MRLGKRTARLVREAAVMGFVQGAMWGQVHPDVHGGPDYPRDSDVLARVVGGARSHSDLYPTLSRAEFPEEVPGA